MAYNYSGSDLVRVGDFVKVLKYRKKHPRPVKVETVDEYIKKGGEIEVIPPNEHKYPSSNKVSRWFIVGNQSPSESIG